MAYSTLRSPQAATCSASLYRLISPNIVYSSEFIKRPRILSGKGSIQIGDQVADIFEADGNTNEIRRDPHAQLNLAGHRSMGHGGGVLNQRFHSAQRLRQSEDPAICQEVVHRRFSAAQSE